jgi:stage II sporulation protein D
MIKKLNALLIAFVSIVTIGCTSQTKLFDDEPLVKVRIINTLDTLDVKLNGKWRVDNSEITDEWQIIRYKNEINFTSNDSTFTLTDQVHFIPADEDCRFNISSVPYGIGWWWAGEEDRIYEGKVSLYINDQQKFDVVVELPLEQYLKGVVPYEMGGDSPLDALKAQAVAARSEAVIALTSGLYSGPNYDLTSDVECQVFSGNHKRTKSSDRAVEETRSLILTEGNKPINAYYASNCGGHAELIKNVWPDRPRPSTYQSALSDDKEHVNLSLSTEEKVREWIASSPDVYCNPSLNELPAWSQKNFRWKRDYSINKISEMISGENGTGILKEIIPVKRGVSGRIYKAKFVFEQDAIEINGELNIRQMVHPPLRSSCFVVDKTDSSFIITGAGWGHGVGMCQSGAVAQAKNGRKFHEILGHYYTQAIVKAVY